MHGDIRAMIHIVYNTKAKELACEVALVGGFDVGGLVEKTFPDGESYVRVKDSEKLSGKTVWVFFGMYPDPNNELVRLCLALDAVRGAAPNSVGVIIPYFPYARQERRYRKGEALSFGAVVRMIGAFGVRNILTVNSHACRLEDKVSVGGVHIINLDAVPMVLKALTEGVDKYTLVGVDKGSEDLLKVSSGHMAKRAKAKTCDGCGKSLSECDCPEEDIRYSVQFDEEPFPGPVVIIDDIIGSARTLDESMKGFTGGVRVGCVHGLFREGADERLASVECLVSTNTVPSKHSKVSVASLIAGRVS